MRKMQKSTSDHGSRESVAVVGTGMAGLVAAYLLKQDCYGRFDVEVFEAQDQLSLDSASVTVASEDGKQNSRVDQPMRAFDRGFYRNLTAMYDFLGVRYHQQLFFFSFARLPKLRAANDVGGGHPKPYFVHSSHNHQIPPVRPEECGFWEWIFETAYLAIYLLWFTLCSLFIRPKDSRLISRDTGTSSPCESLGQYFRRIWLPTYFVESYLIPGLASIATCSHDELLNFPAQDIIDYKSRSYNNPHLRVSRGVTEVQQRLSKGLRIRFDSRVVSVTRSNSGVQISWETRSEDGLNTLSYHKTFDHVILAVPPPIVGAIFTPLRTEMSSIPTAAVESIIHRDTSIISSSKTQHYQPHQQYDSTPTQTPAQWIHFRSSSTITEAIHQASPSVLVTNFPVSPIDPSKIIGRTYFTRTLRTPRSREIVNRIFGSGSENIERTSLDPLDEKRGEIQGKAGFRNGDGNIWLVGSWCWDGMVLLEGCVVSAMRVAESLGVDVPWKSL